MCGPLPIDQHRRGIDQTSQVRAAAVFWCRIRYKPWLPHSTAC